MKNALFLLCFLVVASMYGQSRIYKTLDVSMNKEVFIDLNTAFFVEITNSQSNRINIQAESEGEYKDHILVTIKDEENRILIKDDIQPFSENYNDKLSTHKVMALKMKMEIPKNTRLTIQSRTASLQMSADFDTLFVALQNGDCTIDSFIGDATIHTLNGHIILYTDHATVTAESKTGNVAVEEIMGIHQVQLKSISGDISVYKTK